MIKNFRKAVTFIGLSVVITIMAVTPAFAIDYTFENSLTSLAQIGTDGKTSFVSPDKGINDTYWGELESKTITNVEHNTYYGVFPKYVLNPGETALQELGIGSSGQGSAGYFPSSGITETVAGMQIVDPIAFYRLGYLVGEDTYAPPHADLKATNPVPNRVNPFGFKEAELLTQAEIKDSRKLTVFGDIKKPDLPTQPKLDNINRESR